MSLPTDQAIPASTKPVPVLLEPELLEQVQDAAAIHGVSMAAWLRHAVCQVPINDFPASWRAGETAGRCHESGYYQRKFGLRLDHGTSQKLEALSQALHRPAADVIHQLVAQVTPEGFPASWQLAGEARQHRQPEPLQGPR
jgi:hypothetical protein